MTSTAYRRPLASVMVRWTTSSDNPRQSCTLTPYFFSKAAASGVDSVGASDV